MRVLIVPDKFKSALKASVVADHMEVGIRRVLPDVDVVKVPMADGGEGTVESLVDATNGEIIKLTVKDPLLRNIEGHYGITGDKETAIIEMAVASGLYILKGYEKDPLRTSTYGTGMLIKDALDKGCKKFIIGIGGSATNDGGTGMATALGVTFTDENDKEVWPGGGELGKIRKIDISGLDKRIRECKILVACDVKNPLTGEKGASHIYGPQKGATPGMIEILDKNLGHYGKMLERYFHKSIIDYPGSGAAGGLGAGMMAFLDAELMPGVDIIMQAVGLEKKIKDCDLVITGEGMADSQTAYGKTVSGIALLAKRLGKPVIVVAGSLGNGVEVLYEIGVTAMFSTVNRPMSLDEAIAKAPEMIEDTLENIFRIVNMKLDSCLENSMDIENIIRHSMFH